MKTSLTFLATVVALLSTSANAHIQLKKPVPFRTSTQAPQNAASQDFDMKAPLMPSGANFPCKGYHKDTKGTQALESWAAGSTQTMTFDGSATHGGGSCQASLSEDGGATWKVMKSFIGGCPQSSASFTVPNEAKAGDAIFAWTWFNNQGNREMYMNCAAVTITGGGSGLSSFPDMFTANIGNGCTTSPGDLAFPNPGKNVEGSGGIPPQCGTAGSNSPVGSGAPSPSAPAPSAPAPSAPAPSSPAPSPTKPPGGTGGGSKPAPTSVTAVAPPAPSGTGTRPPQSSYGPQTPQGGACTEGSITCNADGTWSLCASGVNQNMGKPAAGTKCANGEINGRKTKRYIRFSSEHMARNAV